MSDITPQTIADRLQTLAAEMLDVAAEMDYFGGFSLIGQHGKELAGAAVIAQSWADGIREDYPAEDDAAPEQPTDRAALQAAGTHPAPCARHCEANAYQLEARRISAERDALSAWLAELDGQEPAAWKHRNGTLSCRCPEGRASVEWAPLYTRPIPAKPVNAQLLDALIQCRDRFAFYVGHHLEQGDMGKAAENERFFDLANRAISDSQQIQHRTKGD